jgi:hypothetical protein
MATHRDRKAGEPASAASRQFRSELPCKAARPAAQRDTHRELTLAAVAAPA